VTNPATHTDASAWRTEQGQRLHDATASLANTPIAFMDERNISFVRRQQLNNVEADATLGGDGGGAKEIFEWQIKCPTWQCSNTDEPPKINIGTLLNENDGANWLRAPAAAPAPPAPATATTPQYTYTHTPEHYCGPNPQTDNINQGQANEHLEVSVDEAKSQCDARDDCVGFTEYPSIPPLYTLRTQINCDNTGDYCVDGLISSDGYSCYQKGTPLTGAGPTISCTDDPRCLRGATVVADGIANLFLNVRSHTTLPVDATTSSGEAWTASLISANGGTCADWTGSGALTPQWLDDQISAENDPNITTLAELQAACPTACRDPACI
jgi:hypothetical protein